MKRETLYCEITRNESICRLLKFSLIFYFSAFYVANIWEYSAHEALRSLKWLGLAVLLLVSILLAEKMPPSKRAGSADSGYLLIAFFASVSSILSSTGSLFVLASLLLSFFAAALLLRLLQSHELVQTFYKSIEIVGVFVIVSSVVLFLFGINLGRGSVGFSGWVDNPNTLGLMLAAPLIILLARILDQEAGWKYKSLPLFSAGIIILLLTQSRGAVIFLSLSALAFWVARKGMSTAAVFAAVLLFIMVGWGPEVTELVSPILSQKYDLKIEEESLIGPRIEAWAFGWELFQYQPFFGHGIGSSQPIMEGRRFVDHHGLHFHSSYVTALVETGALGLSAMLLMLLTALIKGYRRLQFLRYCRTDGFAMSAVPWAILVGALGHGLVETWFLSAGSAAALLLWTMIGLILISPSPKLVRRKLSLPHRG